MVGYKQAILLATLYVLMSCQQVPTSSYTAFFQPNDLRVELLKGHWVYDVKDAQPEFSWAIYGDNVYGQQTAYQIQLWDLSLGPQSHLIWDSGKQKSSQSNAVPFAGERLLANRDYKWRVKVWLNTSFADTVESSWSPDQLFITSRIFNDSASQHKITSSTIEPDYIKKLPSGRYLIDFGKVAFGYLALTLTSDKAGELTVYLAERGNQQGAISKLDEKSSVRYYPVRLRVNAKKDVYAVHPPRDERNTKAGKAIAIPGKFGRITPFRYVEIDPGELTISDIQAQQIALHYPFNPYSSSFESSDDSLNAIWDLAKYSMKATSFAGVYVDGDRERIPYEADAYINQLSHYLVDDEYSLARYSLEYLLDHPTWPTEWKQHSVMMAWTDWMYTGDLELVKHNYSTIKSQNILEHLANEAGLLESFPTQKPAKSRDIVDWPHAERDGFEFKKINTVVNAFHYLNLKQMAQLADAIGEIQDATFYRHRAQEIYQAFNSALFDKDTGLYIDGVGSNHSSAHANILPLAVGLVPPERKAKVISFIKSKKMAVSVYFAQYLLEALYLNDEADYALSLLVSKQKRSWHNMLRVGSTITLEAWDDEFKPNQDWNHAWGAVPGNIVGRFILGVTPLNAGFDQVKIAPQLSSLSFVKGTIPTIKGPITISTEQVVGKSVIVEFTIPNNVTAIVSLPFIKGDFVEDVKINGQRVVVDVTTGLLAEDRFSPGKYKIEVSYQYVSINDA